MDSDEKIISRIQRTVSRRGDDYVKLMQKLVRTSAAGEETLQQCVAKEMEALGCSINLLKHRPQTLAPDREFVAEGAVDTAERVTASGRLSGAGSGRSLLLFAHPDAEPFDGGVGWQHDPYAAEIEGNRLYGWGVADDLLGVAAMIAGLSAAIKAAGQPSGKVILASSASKRDAYGILAVLDAEETPDAAIYIHPAESGDGLADIKATTSGLLRFQITVEGSPPPTVEPSHTPVFHRAVDPLEKAWTIFRALKDLDAERGRRVHHPMLDAAVGRSTNLHVSFMRYGNFDKLSRVARELTMAGTVAFPPGEALPAVQQEISLAIEKAAAGDPWLRDHPPRVDWLLGTTGVDIPQSSPIYQTVRNAIQAITGIEPRVQSLHSGSDIRVPVLHKGIPTVGFGSLSGNLTQAGGHDEWIDIPDYLEMIKVIAVIISEWCKD